MRAEVLSCAECGGSVKVSDGQFLSKCNYCGTDYYVKQKYPPAILIRRSLSMDDAKNIVLKKLRDKEVSTEFLKNSYFERGTLYFIPFLEIRGIKTKLINSPTGEERKFGYVAFEYIERGSELTELDLNFIDMNSIEETLVNAEQDSFDLVKMRRSGIVLPVSDSHLKKSDPDRFPDPEIVEFHYRVVYLPVWEINYSYRGIIFHSYISAVDGAVIELKAMKNHRKKLLSSITGLAVLGLLFAEIIKMGFFFFLSSGMGNEKSTYLLFGVLGGFILFLFIFSILFPYFWEMYAFREYLVITKYGTESKTINFEDNFLTKSMKRISEKFGKILDSIKIKVDDEQ